MKTNTALGKEVQANTGLKLGDFKTMEDTARYVDAIVSSGSIEEARGSVYVLGNSESGKTSLCKTLREYCKNDNEAPAAILEERETRTKVLDFVKEVQLRQKARKTVTACKSTKSLLGTINYEKNKTATDDGGDEAVEGIKTTFVDFGGHNEYVSCSSVFLKEKGIFLICFPKSKFADADEATFEKTFFPSIGTYLELALEKCDEPMFFLVATKADEAEKSKNCQRIMDKAKAHLKAIADETKRPWIFDKVFETALYEGQADADLQDRLDDLRDMLVAIFRNKQLMDVKLMAVPRSWRKMMDRWKQPGQVTKDIDEAVREFEDYNQEIFKQGDSSGTVGQPQVWQKVVASLRNAVTVQTYSAQVERDKGTKEENNQKTEEIEEEEDELPVQTLGVDNQIKQNQTKGESNQKRSEEIEEEKEDKLPEEAGESYEKMTEETPEKEARMTEARKNAERVLNFFSSNSEILWFK